MHATTVLVESGRSALKSVVYNVDLSSMPYLLKECQYSRLFIESLFQLVNADCIRHHFDQTRGAVSRQNSVRMQLQRYSFFFPYSLELRD